MVGRAGLRGDRVILAIEIERVVVGAPCAPHTRTVTILMIERPSRRQLASMNERASTVAVPRLAL